MKASSNEKNLDILENIDNRIDFLSTISDKEGIPVWDQSFSKIFSTKSNSASKSSSTEIFYLPLIDSEKKHLTSLLFVKNLNSESPIVFTITNIELLNFVNNDKIDIKERENLLLTFLYFDNQIFGSRKYTNIPLHLFENIQTKKKFKTFDLKQSNEISGKKSSSTAKYALECVAISHCTGCNGSCDQCNLCVSNYCSFVWSGGGGSGESNGGSGGNGTDSGGGSSSGSNSSTPWYLANTNVDIYKYNSNVRFVFRSLYNYSLVLEKEQLDALQANSALTLSITNCLANNTEYKTAFIYSILNDYNVITSTVNQQKITTKLNIFFNSVFTEFPNTNWTQFYNFFITQNQNILSLSDFTNYKNSNKTVFDVESGDISNNTTGGYDSATYSTFNPQQNQWPNIPNVIPVNQFIGWLYPGIKKNCMDYAKAQISIKGYQISNYYESGQTYQIYREQTGVDQNALTQGLSYLKYALTNNIPVIVGIHDAPGHTKNLDLTTDHFIVIVGMGNDSNGKYFTFYDNASGNSSLGANSDNKLYYYSDTGLVKGISKTPYAKGLTYTITHIRKSKNK